MGDTGGKETRVKAVGGNATGVQFSQETVGKGDRLMGERD